MKPITKYQSDNGAIFDTEQEALEEDAISKLESIFNEDFSLRFSARTIAETIIENLEYKIKEKL